MTHDQAIAWAEALESGKYAQGKYALKKIEVVYNTTGMPTGEKTTYCCLGVLCEINGKELETNGRDQLLYEWMRTQMSAMYVESFCVMNDRRKLSFKEIANFIRTYAKQLTPLEPLPQSGIDN